MEFSHLIIQQANYHKSYLSQPLCRLLILYTISQYCRAHILNWLLYYWLLCLEGLVARSVTTVTWLLQCISNIDWEMLVNCLFASLKRACSALWQTGLIGAGTVTQSLKMVPVEGRLWCLPWNSTVGPGLAIPPLAGMMQHGLYTNAIPRWHLPTQQSLPMRGKPSSKRQALPSFRCSQQACPLQLCIHNHSSEGVRSSEWICTRPPCKGGAINMSKQGRDVIPDRGRNEKAASQENA